MLAAMRRDASRVSGFVAPAFGWGGQGGRGHWHDQGEFNFQVGQLLNSAIRPMPQISFAWTSLTTKASAPPMRLVFLVGANPRLNRATPYQWHFKLSVTSRWRSFVEFKAGRLVAVLQRHVDAIHVTLNRLSRLQQRGPEQDGDLEVFGAT